MNPTWTILIATLGQRSTRFLNLLETLLPQVEKRNGYVSVSALWNNGERSLAEVRQDLVMHAKSDYISFIDDDDMVPEYYVDEVLPLLDGVDYIGWRMQCIMYGRLLKPTFHSLRYKTWWEDGRGYYRDISHLNPVKTSIAKTADYRINKPPEDISWAEQLRGRLKSEHYIEKIMYYYYSSLRDSTWRGSNIKRGITYIRPVIQSPYFSYHPRSSR